MTNPRLAIYLNDHLAGAVAALEMLENLREAHAGSALAQVLVELQSDIEADRDELEALMARLAVVESRPRKVAGWLGEKAAQLKLRLDDSVGGAMRLFESLEVLSLGIEGKHGLWRTLATLAEGVPELRGVDYASLIERAKAQRLQVEIERLRAAVAALSGPT
jgi:Xaa-Pro aminopeptidase